MDKYQADLNETKELNKKSRMGSTSTSGMQSSLNDTDIQETKDLNKKSRENKK